MIKQLSNFFKKDSAGPVVIVHANIETPVEAAPTEAPTPEPVTETAPEPEPEATPEPTPEAEPTAQATITTVAATETSISAARLAELEGCERELNALRPKYEVLETWYNNVKGSSAGVGTDASNVANSAGAAAKSWENAPWNK